MASHAIENAQSKSEVKSIDDFIKTIDKDKQDGSSWEAGTFRMVALAAPNVGKTFFVRALLARLKELGRIQEIIVFRGSVLPPHNKFWQGVADTLIEYDEATFELSKEALQQKMEEGIHWHAVFVFDDVAAKFSSAASRAVLDDLWTANRHLNVSPVICLHDMRNIFTPCMKRNSTHIVFKLQTRDDLDSMFQSLTQRSMDKAQFMAWGQGLFPPAFDFQRASPAEDSMKHVFAAAANGGLFRVMAPSELGPAAAAAGRMPPPSAAAASSWPPGAVAGGLPPPPRPPPPAAAAATGRSKSSVLYKTVLVAALAVVDSTSASSALKDSLRDIFNKLHRNEYEASSIVFANDVREVVRRLLAPFERPLASRSPDAMFFQVGGYFFRTASMRRSILCSLVYCSVF